MSGSSCRQRICSARRNTYKHPVAMNILHGWAQQEKSIEFTKSYPITIAPFLSVESIFLSTSSHTETANSRFHNEFLTISNQRAIQEIRTCRDSEVLINKMEKIQVHVRLSV